MVPNGMERGHADTDSCQSLHADPLLNELTAHANILIDLATCRVFARDDSSKGAAGRENAIFSGEKNQPNRVRPLLELVR